MQKFAKGFFGEDILIGWQSIAAYLGRSVSTIKRYEKNHSLPVRRFPSYRPYALRFELDQYFVILDDLMHGRKIKHGGNRKRQSRRATKVAEDG